jgi:isoleucyl-tRNA synthetase
MCSEKTRAAASCTNDTNAPVSEKTDYKSTLKLPETSFSMRANAARTEPEFLASWGEDNGYARLRKARAGAPAFTLHDGPPYANGHLHMGHALNKVLKDMVCRSRREMGFDARFRPGWDCHGLPVEWKVEEQYRDQGRAKEDVPVLEFRAACRSYAARWVDVQRDEFRRLGVAADWKAPYLTMDFSAEASVARSFLSMVDAGLVYQDLKPVMWSPVEQTALAEAEVEYHDRKTPAAWVAYRAVSGPLAGVDFVAWTTTPWTLPASVALAVSPRLSYGLYKVERQTDEAWAEPGQVLLLADNRVAETAKALRLELSPVRDVSLDEMLSTKLAHPLKSQGDHWEGLLPCLCADHVTGDAGTGLVHTAPAHGADDYKLGRRENLPMPSAVDRNGRLLECYGALGGARVLKDDGKDGDANARVFSALTEAGTLLGRKTLSHSYPHSWRSKAPVLFLATPQWFVGVDRPLPDGDTMRSKALDACEKVNWLPQSGKRRMLAMLKDRPDWVLSRQRAWGVPLVLFTRKDLPSDHPDFLLRDPKVDARVLAAFEAEGADAWYKDGAAARFLSPDYDPELYEQCMDVLDVWFDSGSSHSWALGKDEAQADLYLEGTDQHRGWFQHALLHGVAMTGQAPFKAVMTHGFTLDAKGRKMSKSLENTVTPEEVVKRYGADVLRLWVALADTRFDLKAGDQPFNSARDAYRKLRNTLRYLMGVLHDTPDTTNSEYDQTKLPLLERWLLHRCHETGSAVMQAWENYDMAGAMHATLAFCTRDLSGLYLNTRKDVLYCDPDDSPGYVAARHTLSVCLSGLLSWMSPALVFTTAEARKTLPADYVTDPLPSAARPDPEAETEMENLLTLRDEVLLLLEEKRRSGSVTRSERMHVTLPSSKAPQDLDSFRELCLLSKVTVSPGVSEATAQETAYSECARCRCSTPDVARRHTDELCDRCNDML